MSKLTKAVQEFLTAMKSQWQELGPTHYEVIIPGKVARWVWTAHWEDDDSFFASYSGILLIVPARHRQAAAEYLTRANHNLRLGNFEMDHSTGGVWFKTSMIMEGVGARYIHKEYLTGTAITIIVVLLILLVAPRGGAGRAFRRCPVCDHTLLGRGQYCSDCGSKV